MKNIYKYYEESFKKNILDKYESAEAITNFIKLNLKNLQPLKIKNKTFFKSFIHEDLYNELNKNIEIDVFRLNLINKTKNIKLYVYFFDYDKLNTIIGQKNKYIAGMYGYYNKRLWRFNIRPKDNILIIGVDAKNKDLNTYIKKYFYKYENYIIHELIHYFQHNKYLINYINENMDYWKQYIEHESYANQFLKILFDKLKRDKKFKEKYINSDIINKKKLIYKEFSSKFPFNKLLNGINMKKIDKLIDILYNMIEEKI